jgi:catechol 2,3-dioxygenase-like lactoylglutathione lyase family enzyme
MPETLQEPGSSEAAPTDDRPRFGIGHLSIEARNVADLANFYTKVGMRLVVDMGRFAILELRGGTHLIVQPGTAGGATLDLIVDEIDQTHALLEANDAQPGPISRGNPHDRFVATDPEGNTLVVNSNHAIGPV